jgi:hypothetical protein
MTYIPELTLESGAIDAEATGANSMGVTKKAMRPTAVQFEILSDDTASVAASISIGTNSADYDNILAITALTGLLVTGKILTVSLAAVVDLIPAGTEVFAKGDHRGCGYGSNSKSKAFRQLIIPQEFNQK